MAGIYCSNLGSEIRKAGIWVKSGNWNLTCRLGSDILYQYFIKINNIGTYVKHLHSWMSYLTPFFFILQIHICIYRNVDLEYDYHHFALHAKYSFWVYSPITEQKQQKVWNSKNAHFFGPKSGRCCRNSALIALFFTLLQRARAALWKVCITTECNPSRLPK